MTMIKGKARSTVTLEWDGTEEELIQFVNVLSEDSLDSLDLGDAMGWVEFETRMYNERIWVAEPTGHTLKSWIDWENFEWEGIQS